MTTDGSESKSPELEHQELQIKILLHEHTMIRTEVILMQTLYKNHIKVLQLSVAGILAIVSWCLSDLDNIPEKIVAYWSLCFAIITMIPVLCGYMIFDIFHTIYSMMLLGARTDTIEDQINILAGPNLLIWEKISKVFFGQCHPKKVWNPTVVHTILTSLIVLALMGAVPWFSYWYLLTVADQSGICHPEWWVGAGGLLSAIIVGACFWYGLQVLLCMRPRVAKFIDDLMNRNEARANVRLNDPTPRLPKR